MYSGRADESIAWARTVQLAHPAHPLGYLLEADALWWRIYCMSAERRYNTIDAWSQPRPPDPAHDAYLALADTVIRLAEASIAKSDTAEMQLYAGMGYALRARLLGLRYEKLGTARAGVESRRHLLRCLELDPAMDDAYLGLGLYNYFVDTLSAMAKVLRFFMGIPGGDKKIGLRQLEAAAEHGELTQFEARFNLAKNLRNYDHDYAHALDVAAPLAASYPGNAMFALLAGDIAAKLGHNAEAANKFQAAAAASANDPACAGRVQQLARASLDAIGLAANNKRQQPPPTSPR